jgi:hypothetical protein
MKQFILKHKSAFTGTIAILLIGAVTMSFQGSPFGYGKYSVQEEYDYTGSCPDTIPEGKMNMKDFEKLQKDLDRSLLEVTDELKKMDFSKLQKDLETSLKDVDMDKIRKDVELALKSIDMDKLMADLGSSMKKLNHGYDAEIERALADAKKEIEKARLEIKDFDKDAFKKNIEQAKTEIEKARVEIDKIDMDKIMAEAREGIDKAKTELRLKKEMFTEMEKDGLISSKNGFTVEYKNNALYIDGKKQTEKITDKYRKYFNNENFKITIDKD